MSHAYVRGRRPRTGRQGLLGVDLEFDRAASAWRLTNVPPVDTRSAPPWGLADPAVGAAAGDLLTAIDGRRLDEDRSPASQLGGKAGREVRCELVGTESGKREVVCEALADERPLRYASWVLERRRLVAEMTNGRAAYIHLPDVSARTKTAVEHWLWCHEDVGGLIVDVRYNEGGTYGGEIAEFLARRPIAHLQTRWSSERAVPVGSGVRPFVVLTNRFTSSGGELLAEMLRQLTGGRVVGERTFGAGVGHVVGRRLPDGSNLLLPEIEIVRPGEWASVENRGVLPDIHVGPREESRGQDPFVLKALGEL